MGKAKHSGSAVWPSEHPFRTRNLIPQQLRLTAECLPQELSLAKGIFLAQGDTFSLEAAHIQWLATGGVNKGQVQPTCHNSGHWKPTPATEIPSDQLMLPLWLYIPIQLHPLPNELPPFPRGCYAQDRTTAHLHLRACLPNTDASFWSKVTQPGRGKPKDSSSGIHVLSPFANVFLQAGFILHLS